MKKVQGFTLIEILIALGIFSILAVLTGSAMFNAFNTRSLINAQADRLISLQMAISLIERDLHQITDRAIRGNDMLMVAALVGQSQYLEITRDGVVNPESVERRSTMKRVALLCQNGQLIRRIWPVLDNPNRKAFEDITLMDKLTECKFSYINQHKQSLSEWHETLTSVGKSQEPFPIAIQISITLSDWGNGNLLFIIPEGLYAQPKL